MDELNIPLRGFNTRGAASYLGLSPKTLANWRAPGSREDGPRFRVAGRKIIYERADLDSWLEAQPKRSRNPKRAINDNGVRAVAVGV